jgi:hypothetical protein
MAVAVRLAEEVPDCAAIVLMTEPGRVRLAAPSRTAFARWSTWRSGSEVQPAGPLAKAFTRNARCEREVYRWNMGYAVGGFCDSLRVSDGLVVAVISDKRSDGEFEIGPVIEPSYRAREDWCEYCNEERSVGWCDDCRSRRCRACDRCGCSPAPIVHPTCAKCHTSSRTGQERLCASLASRTSGDGCLEVRHRSSLLAKKATVAP